jgi:glutathione S-transferase
MLEELGLPYERVQINMGNKEHKSPEFMAINPNGKVPALVDGELKLFESMAINQYLAEKTNSALAGTTAKEKGLIAQWSYWSILELQKPAVDWLIQAIFVPEERRDASLIERSKKAVPPLLKILDTELMGKKYLVGNSFTLADLNTASVVNILVSLGFPMNEYTHVNAWLETCKARPSYKKLSEIPN